MNLTPNKNAEFVVGVDLGGTNVRASIISHDEKIIGHVRNHSEARLGAQAVIDTTAITIVQAIKEAGLRPDQIGAVGMAVPGHIDTRSGIIRWSPNFGTIIEGVFHVFVDVPFTGPVAEKVGIATYMGNDANVAALGEFRYGAGRGTNDMVMFTLGTGIGSGVICDGKLVIGSTGAAVELGHQVIVAGGQRCGCGTFGCLEAYCGTYGIVNRALTAIENGRPSLLHDAIGTDRGTLTPKQIDDAAKAGDSAALHVWEETGYYLGIGIGNSVNIFNPEKIVIGGGIRQATGLIDAARRSMERHSISSIRANVSIVEAELGDDAGVMGAAELAWRMVNGA